MVGGHHVDAAVQDGRANLFPVVGRFDRGVPLDVGAFVRVVRVAEPEVVDARLRGDALVFELLGPVEQVQLTGCADVQNVQLRVQLGGQFHGLRRTAVACFGAADEGVLVDGHMFAVALLRRGAVGPNRGLVLAVGRHQRGSFFEDPFEHLGFVDQHVSGRGAHEDFDAADTRGVGFEDLVQVVVAGAHEEAVVHRADFRGPVVLVLKQVLREGLGDGVGHLHERGDAPCRRGRRFGGDFRLVGQPRLTEVDLVVDASWHQPLARAVLHFGLRGEGLDFRVAGALGQIHPNGHNAVSRDEHILHLDGAFVDNVGLAEEGGVHGIRRVCRTDRKCVGSAFGGPPRALLGKCSCSFWTCPTLGRRR